jgi:dynein heavy chain
MTGLFVKITNQMITNCKYNIVNFRILKLGGKPKGFMGSLSDPKVEVSATFEDAGLWDETKYPHDELIAVLQSCQQLKEAYIKQYMFTKERLESMPKAKQFDFNTTEIFGKFELFSRRVRKLIELFSTIRQFKTLEKHNLENIQPIVDTFNEHVNRFAARSTILSLTTRMIPLIVTSSSSTLM